MIKGLKIIYQLFLDIFTICKYYLLLLLKLIYNIIWNIYKTFLVLVDFFLNKINYEKNLQKIINIWVVSPIQFNCKKNTSIKIFTKLTNITNIYSVYLSNSYKNTIFQIKSIRRDIVIAPSNILKYYSNLIQKKKNIFLINFLRKNKIFNKGRYSRNRQYYRTGVYWCLYINIVAVTGLYFWFYHIVINYTYLWWFFFAFIFSFILPKTINYNFFNIYSLGTNLYKNIMWLLLILLNINSNILNLVLKLVKSYLYIIWEKYLSVFFNMFFVNAFFFFYSINAYIWDYSQVNYYLPILWIQRKYYFTQFKQYIFIWLL